MRRVKEKNEDVLQFRGGTAEGTAWGRTQGKEEFEGYQ